MTDEPLIGTVMVTEIGRTDHDTFLNCLVRRTDDGGLEIIRAADEATLGAYAPGCWSGVRIDDGRTLVLDLDNGEDDEG